MCFSLKNLPFENGNITKRILFLNKKLIFRQLKRLSPFLCSAFSVDVVRLSFEFMGMMVYASRKSSNYLLNFIN